LDDFELSQAYLFFWDKIERSNYFLHAIADSYRRSPKEEVDGRLVSFLLKSPISDGGQWDMVVNLIEKHGVMPKKCFPETHCSEKSLRMNAILKSKLREFAHDIHKHIDKGNDDNSVISLIRDQMKTIYRIVCICLGSPPKEFTWEYYNKSKKYQKIENISPLEFYLIHVKPSFDVSSKVCLVSDPRPKNPTGQTYTVDCLGNVVGGRKTIYNNQPIESLIDVTAKSIKNGEPVWFGCEVGKHMASKEGILDLNAHDYQMVFDTNVNLNLSKAERLLYGDSLMTHAMVLTGYSVENYEDILTKKQNDTAKATKTTSSNLNKSCKDQVADDCKDISAVKQDDTNENKTKNEHIEEKLNSQLTQMSINRDIQAPEEDFRSEIIKNITKWRVENSWGEDRNEKGFLIMTNEWFHQFVFEVVVDRKYCTPEILDAFDLEPKVLPAWDPMGALAR